MRCMARRHIVESTETSTEFVSWVQRGRTPYSPQATENWQRDPQLPARPGGGAQVGAVSLASPAGRRPGVPGARPDHGREGASGQGLESRPWRCRLLRHAQPATTASGSKREECIGAPFGLPCDYGNAQAVPSVQDVQTMHAPRLFPVCWQSLSRVQTWQPPPSSQNPALPVVVWHVPSRPVLVVHGRAPGAHCPSPAWHPPVS
jgi:hypothetical protein